MVGLTQSLYDKPKTDSKSDTFAGLSLEVILQRKLRHIHDTNRNHPMFGASSPGRFRLPLKPATRANEQSWFGKVTKIAEGVMRAHQEVGRPWTLNGGCWLSRSNQFQITRPSGPHSSEVLCSITTTRFLAFIWNPSAQNWDNLTEGEGVDTPYDHRCHRGWARNNNSALGCLNVKDHGGFGTKDGNESRKDCRGRCAALCPEHPAPGGCVFTHDDDGTLQPCRMVRDHLPICHCARPCFGRNREDL